jgi:hypothetical protein
MALWRSDDIYPDLTSSDCKEIFLTSLKGSSDISYDLFRKLCSEYEVDPNSLGCDIDHDHLTDPQNCIHHG